MMDEIYNDLHTIIRLDMKPILNEENAELFRQVYSSEFIKSSREKDELDIVYNFHLNRILNNLIEVEKILND